MKFLDGGYWDESDRYVGNSKARVVAEAAMTLPGYQQLDIDAVRSYVAGLWNILEESEVAQRKAFLRSFVKKWLKRKG